MTAPNFLPEFLEELVESCLDATPLKLPFLDNVLVMSMAFADRSPEKLAGMDVRVAAIDAFARIWTVIFPCRLELELDVVPTLRLNGTLDKVVVANIFTSMKRGQTTLPVSRCAVRQMQSGRKKRERRSALFFYEASPLQLKRVT